MTDIPEPDPAATPTAGERCSAFLVIFPSIMLPMFLAVIDQTIVATALPAIASDIGDIERAPWIVVSYLIAATIAAPLYGRLGDAFGRRRLMFVALTIFILASVACAAAPTVALLTAARVLQGLGGGGLMTLSQALVGEAVPPRERARWQGWLATVVVTANAVGPVAGGYLTEHFGWPSIFLINIPLGIVAIFLTMRLPVRAPQGARWRADPGGLLLLTAFVATTLVALEQMKHADFSALPLAAALLACGVIAAVLLIRHETRTASPVVPFTLLRQPAIWRSDALAACHGAALVSMITFLPVYLQVVHGVSPSRTGLLLTVLTLGLGLGSIGTGRLMSRTGRTTVFPATGLAIATSVQIFFASFGAAVPTSALAVAMFLGGLGMGTVMGVVQVTVQSAAGRARLGEAAASVQFSRSIGAGLGTALVSTLLFAVLSAENPAALDAFAAMLEHARPGVDASSPAAIAAVRGDIGAAFRAVFLACAGFGALGFLLAVTNPLRRI